MASAFVFAVWSLCSGSAGTIINFAGVERAEEIFILLSEPAQEAINILHHAFGVLD